MAFLTPLDLRAYTSNEWVVLSALIYIAVDGTKYLVPRGFITDLASIPAPLRGIFNPNGLSRDAAVLHDFLYCSHQGTRAQADAMLLEALQICGVGWATRYSMWLGVRVGGWLYWNKRKTGTNQDDFVTADYFNA